MKFACQVSDSVLKKGPMLIVQAVVVLRKKIGRMKQDEHRISVMQFIGLSGHRTKKESCGKLFFCLSLN